MTDTRQHHNQPQKAQIELLRKLAEKTCRPFVMPESSDDAVKKIRGLTSPPTRRQVTHLRRLAGRTGETFAPQTTFTGAREEIDRLEKVGPVHRGDRLRESDEHDLDFAGGFRDATTVREDELAGYGSGAGWA